MDFWFIRCEEKYLKDETLEKMKYMNKKIDIKKILLDEHGYFILFCLVFLLKLLGLCKNLDLTMINDNIGYLAPAVKMAGLNWDDCIQSCSYYGYGFQWIYFWIFKLTYNPYVIYYISYFLQVIICGLCALICQKIQIDYLDAKKTSALVVSLFMASRYSIYYSAEGTIMLCLVLISFVLVFSMRSKHKIASAIFLALFLAYSISIHQRCVALLISVFILLFVWWVLLKEWIVDIRFFLPTILITYFIQKCVRNTYISSVWDRVNKGNVTELENTSAINWRGFWFVKNMASFKIFIKALLSNWATLCIKSYGIVVIALLIVLLCLILVLKNKSFDDKQKASIVLILFSVITTAIVLVGVGVRWGSMIPRTTGYKGFTYSRYYLIFIWPAVLGIFNLKSLNICCDEGKKVVSTISMGILLITYLIFFAFLYDDIYEAYLIDNNVHLERVSIIPTGISNVTMLIVMSTLITLMVILIYMVLPKNKAWVILMILIVYSIMTTVSSGFEKPTITSSRCGALLEFYIYNKEAFPEEIYVVTNSDGYNLPQTAQFILNRCKIRQEIPETENAVIFSNERAKEIATYYCEITNYKCIVLDDNEFLYVKGDGYRLSYN